MKRNGFTLLELLITAALMMIIMGGVMAAVIANQRQYFRHAMTSGMQASQRNAATLIEQALSRAGYGIDPNYAIEPWAIDPNTGAEIAGGMRDGSGPAGSDELVVHFRDPVFRRVALGVSSASLSLDAPLLPEELQDFYPGQRLLVVCPGGTDYAYVTADRVDGAEITLGAGSAPFNQQARLDNPNSCLANGQAFVTRVERRHFYVAFAEDALTGEDRALLLMSRGVDLNGNGSIDERPTGWPGRIQDLGDAEVVALDVEQLQVSYVMNRPIPCPTGPGNCAVDLTTLVEGPDADRDFVFGEQPGVAEAPSADNPVFNGSGAPNPLRPPFLNVSGQNSDPTCAPGDTSVASACGYGSLRRYSGHPGNIRSVRFALSSRFARPDQDLPLTNALRPVVGGPLEPLENLDDEAAQPATRHQRLRFYSTVTLRNMFQLRHFSPPSPGGA